MDDKESEPFAFLALAIEANQNIVVYCDDFNSKARMVSYLSSFVPKYQCALMIGKETLATNCYCNIMKTEYLPKEIPQLGIQRLIILDLENLKGIEIARCIGSVPFIVFTNKSATPKSFISRLEAKPDNLKLRYSSKIDIFVSVKKPDIIEIFEYRWLGRAEMTFAEAKESMKNFKVVEIAKNGLLDYAMLQSSKTILSYAKSRMITPENAMRELTTIKKYCAEYISMALVV